LQVGTVDDYQGQEERIVFISTTLSRPESLPPQQLQQQGGVGDDTADRNLGFWRNPKRFNVRLLAGVPFIFPTAGVSVVADHGLLAATLPTSWHPPSVPPPPPPPYPQVAITRAKALLVVVGHPAVLLEDASWRELLRCVGGWEGGGVACMLCGALRGGE
jgi:putative helicase MOV10L1